MNFVSFAFVFLLLPVLVARCTIGRRGTVPALRNIILLASTIFVMWHIPEYIFVMLASIGTDFIAAKRLDAETDGVRRKWILILSLSVNLGLLAIFKYTNFAISLVEEATALLKHRVALPHLDIALPMGISFYTFGSMSYTIDVYRKRMKPVANFKDFYFFVTFFPHMVAGPIIRAENFFKQFARSRRVNVRVFAEGLSLIIYGLFLKMVCADNLAGVVNAHWSSGVASSTVHLGLAFLFSMQIFCDFEGYSSIARGLAYLFGFRFPINFNNPYIAGSFKNFWERWHITLSTWLRDYLYIPLGGNRGSSIRTMSNLLIVMLLGGLWHGASLTFVIWGAIHGIALGIERASGLQSISTRCLLWRFIWYLVVQSTVVLAWVFFRSQSVSESFTFCRHMFSGVFDSPPDWLCNALWFAVPPLIVHCFGFFEELKLTVPSRKPALLRQAVACAVMLYMVLTCYGNTGDFIYFQF